MRFKVLGIRGMSLILWERGGVKGRAGQHFSVGKDCEVMGIDLEQ